MDANAPITTESGQEALPLAGDESSPAVFTPGYHLRPIPKGTFGEADKIAEEVEEFREALEQGSPVMALVELSDLIGAVEGWLAKYHPSITLDDLRTMSTATQRAFRNGHR